MGGEGRRPLMETRSMTGRKLAGVRDRGWISRGIEKIEEEIDESMDISKSAIAN